MSRSTGAPSRAASRARLGLLAVAMLAAFGWLLLRLHDVQVRDAERYVRDQDQTSLRRVRLPATRGRILDRNGAVLAGSRPRYCVAVYLDELRAPGDWSNTVDRVCARLDEVEAILGPDAVRAAGRREVWKHLRLRREKSDLFLCWYVILAIPAFLFTFAGVNKLLPGLHSYA